MSRDWWFFVRYDLIDLTRQALAKYANQLFLKVIEAYRMADLRSAASLSQEFLSLVNDMDTLLGCHEGFLLGPWLESAKKLAKDEEQKKQVNISSTSQNLHIYIHIYILDKSFFSFSV